MATTTATYKVYPSATAGITITANATAWANSNYTELVPINTITSTFYICGFTFMYPNNYTTNTAVQIELDISTGATSSEVVIITIPFITKLYTAVGHQSNIYLPLVYPKEVAANTRLSARVRQSLASASAYAGIKMLYR